MARALVTTQNKLGNTSGSAIPAGYVGEVKTHAPGTFTGSTTRAQIATLILTPGVWVMSAVVSTSIANNLAGGTYIGMCISTTAGNSQAGCTDGYDNIYSAINATPGMGSGCIPCKLVNLATTTQFYLNARTDHTASNDMSCSMSAVRIA